MIADRARQRKKGECLADVDAVDIPTLRDRGSFRLLAFTALHVGTEPSRAQRDGLAVLHIHAELDRLSGQGRIVSAFSIELSRVLAIRVVRAADERAVLSARLKAQLAFAALRTGPRVRSVSPVGKQHGRKRFVEVIDHLGVAQLHHLSDARDEVAPELGQHVAPFQLARGDAVQLLLKFGREVVGDVLVEEPVEEACQHAAARLGLQDALLDGHVLPILKRLHRCRVGGGAPDAELLHPLDQARFAVTGGRLGEMLRGFDLLTDRRLAFAHRGEGLVVILLLARVLGFLAHVLVGS